MPDSPPVYIIHATYKILEATDPTEWSALSADNKVFYNIIISAGTINFAEGTLVRTILLGMFPSGITHDKLLLM